jgi:adenylate kinase family enzyme
VAAADTVVFLDFPRWICLWSVLKRQFLSYGKARPEMHPGCPEHFDWEFLVWIWRWKKRNRPGVMAALEGMSSKQLLVKLKDRRQLKNWLEA